VESDLTQTIILRNIDNGIYLDHTLRIDLHNLGQHLDLKVRHLVLLKPVNPLNAIEPNENKHKYYNIFKGFIDGLFMDTSTMQKHLSYNNCQILMKFVASIISPLEKNSKMLLFCGEGTQIIDKVINDIKKYLGPTLCGHYHKIDDIIHSNIKKLVFVGNIDNNICCLHSYTKQCTQILINLILYEQSIIGVTTNLDVLDPRLLERCVIIKCDSSLFEEMTES